MPSQYVGAPPRVAFKDDGRTIELLGDFGFIDAAGEKWMVPAGALADGASIPRAFWTLIGGPLEGRYRNASIVHDWYCDRRTRTWQATHKVFYEAMLVSGVAVNTAKIMYFAVRWKGPRWENRVIVNSRLDEPRSGFKVGDASDISIKAANKSVKPVKIASPGDRKNAPDAGAVAERVAELVGREALSLEELERLADRADPLGTM